MPRTGLFQHILFGVYLKFFNPIQIYITRSYVGDIYIKPQIYPKIILECLIIDSCTGNNNTEDVNGIYHKLRIKLHNEKQKQTDGNSSTSPTGKIKYIHKELYKILVFVVLG